jgi:hypothetical protein
MPLLRKLSKLYVYVVYTLYSKSQLIYISVVAVKILSYYVVLFGHKKIY